VEPIEVAALEGGALDRQKRTQQVIPAAARLINYNRPERPTDARAVNESIDFFDNARLINYNRIT
jgi:hypothetical protein